MKITYPVARILGNIAESKASDLAVPMAIALMDGEGGLLFFGRMDGTLPASTEIATSKAYTAAVLRMATHELGKLAQPGGELYGIQHTHDGKIVLFGGGLPLQLNGQVVGAIGISGGSVNEDIQVAEYVVNTLEEMEYWAKRIKVFLPTQPLDNIRISQLENRLKEVFEQMNCALPAGAPSLLAGAILLASSEEY
ncbi:MAG: heme-binding protein [Planctomycetaceae bacterium]|nr:MAG: heme-binding protein [Planctomycetaceae bacterium]